MFFTWLDLSIQTSDFKNINLYFCNYVVLNKQLLFFNILNNLLIMKICDHCEWDFFLSFYTYFLFAYSKAIDFSC